MWIVGHSSISRIYSGRVQTILIKDKLTCLVGLWTKNCEVSSRLFIFLIINTRNFNIYIYNVACPNSYTYGRVVCEVCKILTQAVVDTFKTWVNNCLFGHGSYCETTASRKIQQNRTGIKELLSRCKLFALTENILRTAYRRNTTKLGRAGFTAR
jgi:hypothetical protein